METLHQGAIRRMASGGLVTADQDLYSRKIAAGNAAGGAVMNAFNTAANQPLEGMKKGGAIKGKGTGTSDDVPIMASNGEFMIKASAVKKIGIEALEAINAMGDEPEEKDSKSEAKAEYGGMKKGGAIRKMASGGLVTEEDKQRAATVAQIPTAQNNPTPAPDGRDSGNDITRNVNNSLNALGGMGVVASVPLRAMQAAEGGAGAIRSTMNAAPVLQNGMARLAAPAVQTAQAAPEFIAGASGVAKVGGANLPSVITNTQIPVAKATNVALQEGAKANQMAAGTRSLGNASAGLGALDGAQAPLTVDPAAPTLGAVPTPAAPQAQQRMASTFGATDPRRQDVQAPLSAHNRTDIGDGVTKFAIPGKSPLYTNMTDAAGMASNEALMGRGAVNAQNQGAADALVARSEASISNQVTRQMQKEQYDKEVAQATAANQGEAMRLLQEKALGTPAFMGRQAVAPNRAAAVQLGAIREQQTAQRGQDLQATQQGAVQKLAQQKFGLESATAGIDNQLKSGQLQSAQQMQTAQQAVLNAKTPAERVSAEEKMRLLQGKNAARELPAPRMVVVPGAKDAMGNQGDSRLYDPDTKTWVEPPAPKAAMAEGSISTVNGKTAKYTGGKWVPQ